VAGKGKVGAEYVRGRMSASAAVVIKTGSADVQCPFKTVRLYLPEFGCCASHFRSYTSAQCKSTHTRLVLTNRGNGVITEVGSAVKLYL
jgi:hypothetical protein